MAKKVSIKTKDILSQREKYFFACTFFYSLLLGVSFQGIILPMIPELHASFGLLKGDSLKFHNAAVELSQKIKTSGWQAWTVFPDGFSLNVSFLAALYAIAKSWPMVLLPLNAAAQALSACLIYRIGRQLWPGQPGEAGGLGAASIFTISLSPLVWYGKFTKIRMSCLPC